MAELNKLALLGRLPDIPHEETSFGQDDELRQMSLGAALLMLAEINHDHEYELCREVARHLLGKAREPEDIDQEETSRR